ncbi:MAG: iron-sulfur cluster assembly protein [candidate division WOR-3 bacterium]|nr:iron-sulfur cluster assembly protein [candidate division WOR-3 bacterium]MDH7518932.1 iron-sulfur cluster assembly protein [bacterium]
MKKDKNVPLIRTLLILILLSAGIAITLLPHWLRSAKNVQPITLEAQGWSYTGAGAPDSLLIIHRLHRVIDPELGTDLINIGLLETLRIDTAGNVRVVFNLTTPFCPYIKQLAKSTLDTLIATPGVRRVTVKFDPNIRR